jgi:hypothetical protein
MSRRPTFRFNPWGCVGVSPDQREQFLLSHIRPLQQSRLRLQLSPSFLQLPLLFLFSHLLLLLHVRSLQQSRLRLQLSPFCLQLPLLFLL